MAVHYTKRILSAVPEGSVAATQRPKKKFVDRAQGNS